MKSVLISNAGKSAVSRVVSAAVQAILRHQMVARTEQRQHRG